MPQHPAAPHHLHWFITAPGNTDLLFVLTGLLVVGSVLGLGLLFLWLHSLPERWGHKKLQFEIVAMLALISLFTHMHIFWVIALILALIDFPDFTSPLKRLAQATEKLAGIETPSEEEAPPAEQKQSKQGA